MNKLNYWKDLKYPRVVICRKEKSNTKTPTISLIFSIPIKLIDIENTSQSLYGGNWYDFGTYEKISFDINTFGLDYIARRIVTEKGKFHWCWYYPVICFSPGKSNILKLGRKFPKNFNDFNSKIKYISYSRKGDDRLKKQDKDSFLQAPLLINSIYSNYPEFIDNISDFENEIGYNNPTYYKCFLLGLSKKLGLLPKRE